MPRLCNYRVITAWAALFGRATLFIPRMEDFRHQSVFYLLLKRCVCVGCNRYAFCSCIPTIKLPDRYCYSRTMNPPPNKVVIFGSLQKDVPEETAMSPSITPSQFLASPTAPAMGLNYLNTPRLPGFGGGASLFRTYHTARFYDAQVLSWDNHTRQSIPGQIRDSEQATIGTHVRPLRRRRALRGEPPDDRDHSDCSTTAVRGISVRRRLRRASVRFWPYQAAQRQNRDTLHQPRSHNYSTIAQADSPGQSFYDRRCSSLSESAHEVYGGIGNEHVAGPFGLRTHWHSPPCQYPTTPFKPCLILSAPSPPLLETLLQQPLQFSEPLPEFLRRPVSKPLTEGILS